MSAARVLVVDDDMALLEALPEAVRLRMETVTVDTCATASEALERIEATDYDAIISDIKMAGMDGLALLARIRALRPATPTLLITGHGEHDLAVRALRGGAYDFIQKPIDRDYFVASLDRAIHLRRLGRRVKELDELRTQFFANVSHELRTPLSLILGLTEKLLTGDSVAEWQRRDLEVIDRNAHTLLKHVNDLLDIAKLDAGQMDVNYAEVELAHVLRVTAAHFEALARQRRITLSVQTPPTVRAQADAEKLQRVFLNLLSNAFKFVPDGGRVTCALRVERDRVLATVQDNGPGVRPELREVIFERFRQGDGGRGPSSGGTGLGLAIAKEFVTLHRGTIAVEDAPGGGALFSMNVPLAAPADAKVAPAPAANDGREAARQALVALDQARSGRSSAREVTDRPAVDPPSAGAHPPAHDRPLVLIVEDNEEMNRFIAEMLAHEYRVATAHDGQDGLEKALALRPDLILADVIMPRLNGDELVHEVRRRPELATIPLVMLTAKVDDELRVKLLREGVQDYLTKPFSGRELRARVGNLVTIKRARELLQQELASRSNDLAVLAQEVTSRQRQLQNAVAALHEAEERSRVLLESVKDYAIFMLDPQGHVASWNAGAERITGFTADEIIGEHCSRFYPEEEVRRGTPEQDLGRASANGRFEADAWRVRKDGSRFWANAILTALPDADGSFRGFSTVTRDVTERKHAEEQITASLKEKEVLLKEVHHRVKNNLQVICSLLNLQSKAIQDDRTLEVFLATQNRVKSMALIHDQLYRSGDLASIDFAEYVRRLAVNLFRSYAVDPDAVTLIVDVDKVSFGIDMAVPLGLIINELITNSLKHAFPEGRRGEIHIGLRAGVGATCELAISDNGVGLPESDLSAVPSFGLQLVVTLAEQLGGTIDVQRKEGTRFTIRFAGPPDSGRGGGP